MSQIRLEHCTVYCKGTERQIHITKIHKGANTQTHKYTNVQISLLMGPSYVANKLYGCATYMYLPALQFNALSGHQMALCGAGQDSLVEHLGGGSNVKDVKGIPGSYFAFAESLHRLVEPGKTKDLLVFLSCDNSL